MKPTTKGREILGSPEDSDVSELSVPSRREVVRRCRRCVLPDVTPNIDFDTDGICNYCRTYRRTSHRGERALLDALNARRRSDGGYECIVNLSGGRDSTYTLLKVAKDYGMKVLAVNYENPFTHPQAWTNVENAVRRLGVRLVRFHFKNRIHERTFRNNLLTWLRHPTPALVPIVCSACHMMWWQFLRIARHYDVRCLVSGGNPYELTSFKKELLGVPADEELHRSYTRNILGVMRESVRSPAYYRPSCLPTLAIGYLFSNAYALGPRLLARRVTKLDLFHFVEWRENEVISRIAAELDWDYPRTQRSSWRFDCRIGRVKDFMYLKTLGMTEREDFYSKLVREGAMRREEALARVARENEVDRKAIDQALAVVGLSETAIFT